MTENKPVLRLRGVKKTFNPGTPDAKCALNGVTLDVAKGEFITVIGSNGAGKSTLFNAVCGTFYPDEGTITLDGTDITTMPDYRRAYNIGRLYQDPMKGTAPHMTIEENLALAYCRKASRSFFALNKKDAVYFRELLARLGLGLEDRMKTKIGLLSGGQRQAVSLLMSTIAEPKLLLLDEHTAALDPATAQKVLDITVDIVEKTQAPTMMITHDIRAALRLGTRTIMMDEGRVVLDISGEERKTMTVDGLLALYSKESRHELTNDRMLFSIKE